MPVLLKQGDSSTRESEIPISNLRWYFGFFVVSGFCGLVYEVVWLRLAMASFGVTTALVSIVISMFMAGLGLGSWGAGILTRGVLKADGPRALRFSRWRISLPRPLKFRQYEMTSPSMSTFCCASGSIPTDDPWMDDGGHRVLTFGRLSRPVNPWLY